MELNHNIDLLLIAESICKSRKLKLIGHVGGGATKQTFCSQDEKGNSFALKVISSKASELRTQREIDALLRCDHKNIAKLYDVGRLHYQGEEFGYFLEEYLSGGTLTEYINNNGTLNYDQLKLLGKNLMGALTHIAGHKLVHRDIKPDNIILRESIGDPVLVDFGIVRDLDATSLTQTWLQCGPGTPYFASPEQLNNNKSLIDWRTDQFSLGVLLCYSYYGMHPYQYPNEKLFSSKTVERVARREPMHKDMLKILRSSGFECIIKMTSLWPIERYRRPSQLVESWI